MRAVMNMRRVARRFRGNVYDYLVPITARSATVGVHEKTFGHGRESVCSICRYGLGLFARDKPCVIHGLFQRLYDERTLIRRNARINYEAAIFIVVVVEVSSANLHIDGFRILQAPCAPVLLNEFFHVPGRTVIGDRRSCRYRI